jgi:hypothetical protein
MNRPLHNELSETISPNTTLAHSTILSKIGADGIGEVYRARDTKRSSIPVALLRTKLRQAAALQR